MHASATATAIRAGTHAGPNRGMPYTYSATSVQNVLTVTDCYIYPRFGAESREMYVILDRGGLGLLI